MNITTLYTIHNGKCVVAAPQVDGNRSLNDLYTKNERFAAYPLFISKESCEQFIQDEKKRYRETKSKDWGGARKGAGRKPKSST